MGSLVIYPPSCQKPHYNKVFDIYKYDNTLYRVTVTGAELKNYMEWSAQCYNQWKAGDINISFDPEYPHYLYDMFAGVDYEINLSRPKGERIENVMFHGEPLSDEQTLTLAIPPSNRKQTTTGRSQAQICAKMTRGAKN